MCPQQEVIHLYLDFPHFDLALQLLFDSLDQLWSIPPQKYQTK